MIREKSKRLNRVRHIPGPVEAAECALERETGCADIMRLIGAGRSTINGLTAQVTEGHIRIHVDPRRRPNCEPAQATEGSIDVAHAYPK
jgi:DNA-binding FrmR family transcriptional regulator